MSTLEQLDCALPGPIASALRQSAKDLQMMPETATKALAKIKKPGCSIASFAEIVENDVKLASDILRLANSPCFSVGRPIGNLREAVVQVGFRQCQNLIHASCAASLMQDLEGIDESTRAALWTHSLAVGTIASELGRGMNLDFSGEEFTAGLVHDLGRLLLAVIEPTQFKAFDAVDFDERDWNADQEQSATGTNHCIVGCSFAITNKLPDAIAEAIRFHHEPTRATMAPNLVALVAAADDVANHFARQESLESYDATGNLGLSLLKQRYPELATKIDDNLSTVMQTHNPQPAA